MIVYEDDEMLVIEKKNVAPDLGDAEWTQVLRALDDRRNDEKVYHTERAVCDEVYAKVRRLIVSKGWRQYCDDVNGDGAYDS